MYEKLGDDRRLEETYQQALIKNPAASDIADKLLLFFEDKGRFEDAEKVIQKVKTSWQVSNAWQIRASLKAGDISRAINELKLRVSNDNRDAVSRVQLARLIYRQTRDPNQAFTYLDEAETITPGLPTSTGTKASILKAEGLDQEALTVLNEYVADHNDFNAYWMRALFLADEGKFEEAEEDYIKLTKLSQPVSSSYGLLFNFYIGRGNDEKALTAIEEGIKKYPDDLNLQRALMKLLISPGPVQDPARAMEILKLLEEKLPSDTEIMKFIAVQLLEKPTLQSYQTAKEILEKIIKLNTAAVDIHLWLIDLAMQEGNFQAACDYATRALGSNQDNRDLISARAKAELALGETKLAIELSRIVLRQDIHNSTALNVAIQSRDQSLIKEVRSLMDNALETNSADEQLLLSHAKVLASLGNPQDAIPELESYCQTENGSTRVPALLELADLYRFSSNTDKANQYIERAEHIEPDNINVIHARFLWLVAQHRYNELAKMTSAYLSAKEQNPSTLTAAASILTALGSKELANEALKLYEQAVNLSPKMLNARLGLVSCLYQTGNIERAVPIYQELHKEHPYNIKVINDLAWIMQEQNHQYEPALDLINKGLKLAPDDLFMLDTRGTILLKMNRLTEARNDYEKILELTLTETQKKAETLLQLGRICSQLKDSVNTKKYLNEALEIDKKLNCFTKEDHSEIETLLKTE